MNKIQFSAEPDTNYVFHMLSVAKCGYDNAYGEKYRDRYAPADLQCIKDQEIHLTVRGGEHCGDWYGPMVCTPVWNELSAKEYYRETIAWIGAGNLDLPEEECAAVIDICRIMANHYDDYMDHVWPVEKKRIEEYIIPLREIFEKNRFTEKAEDATGISLPPPWFTASLVSCIDGGAEAIDISATHDVFGIGRDTNAEAAFISHEFIIYLLKIALKDESVFQSFENWSLTEGLAEYYLQKIDNGMRSFQSCQEQAGIYRQLEKTHGTDPAALYRAALKLRKSHDVRPGE